MNLKDDILVKSKIYFTIENNRIKEKFVNTNIVVARTACVSVAMYVCSNACRPNKSYVGLYSLCTELHAASMFYSLLSNGFFTQNACASEHCHNNVINVFMKLFFFVQRGPSMTSQGRLFLHIQWGRSMM